jgi:hypothetical protein
LTLGDLLTFIALYIVDAQEQAQIAYTLQTRHGQLLLLFVSNDGELPNFRRFAAETLNPGYSIHTTAVLAPDVKEAGEALKREGLIPSTPTALVLEGTPFFEQVIQELVDDTIWPDA